MKNLFNSRLVAFYSFFLFCSVFPEVVLCQSVNGSVTYAPTATDASSSQLNGGVITVTYTRSNDQTIDPTTYGSAWPASFTQTYTLSDLIPTDAVADADLHFTSIFTQNDGYTYGGLAAVRVRMNMTGSSNPINLVKNINFNTNGFPKNGDPNDNNTTLIFNPSITGTIPGALTTPAYVTPTSTDPSNPNGNFLTCSEYKVTGSLRPVLSGEFSYNTTYQFWSMRVVDNQQTTSSNLQVAFGDNLSFNRVKGVATSSNLAGSVTAEQQYGQADTWGTVNTSNVANVLEFTAIVINFTHSTVPIKLVSFTATNNNCTAALAWATAFEQNSSHYEIEHSIAGTNFTSEASISSKNNVTGAAYNYNYKNFTKGVHYFRIKAVDFDNKFTYSQVVSINSDCNNTPIKISPNPTKGPVNITGLSGTNDLVLFDEGGHQAAAWQTNSSNKILNLSGFAAGVYLLQIKKEDGSFIQQRIVKN